MKRLVDFDFKAQPSLDPKLLDELATGRYLAESRNVILLGPPGVGKTHLAIGLGVACAEILTLALGIGADTAIFTFVNVQFQNP